MLPITIAVRKQARAFAALSAIGLCFSFLAMAQQAGQKTFASAEDASRAFFEAAKSDDDHALLEILGPDGKDVIDSGDAVEDLNGRSQFVVKYEQMHRLAKEPDGSMSLNIGAENWPLPIPLVRKNGAWYFDTAAGRQEIVFRRVGENEMAAVQACHELVDAEAVYYARAHRGEAGRQYARRFISDEQDGRHDGLYWKGATDEFDSPLDPIIAAAGRDIPVSKTDEAVPFNGYYFRILTSQGKSAPGGAKAYVAGGKMTRGFAFAAYPVEYGSSGVMSFLVSSDGVVFQKDLGADTARAATALTQYDPDSTWKAVEQK